MTSVVFEHLVPGHFAAAWYHRLAGDRLFHFRRSTGKRMRWLPRTERLAVPRDYPKRRDVAGEKAFDQASLFERVTVGSRQADTIRRVFGTDEAALALRKKIMLDLCGLHLNAAGHQAAREALGVKNVLFVPAVAETGGLRVGEAGLVLPRYAAPWWYRLSRALENAARRVAVVLHLIRLWRRPTAVRPDTKKRFRLAVPIMSWREFLTKTRWVDFLLDGRELTRDNTLYYVENPLPEKCLAELNAAGLNWVDPSSDRFPFDSEVARRARPLFRDALAAALSGPAWLAPGLLNVLRSYLSWGTLAARHRIDALAAYESEVSYRLVARNALLRASGTKTWFYNSTCNEIPIYDEPEGHLYRSPYWGCFNYDAYATWGPDLWPMRRGYLFDNDVPAAETHFVGCVFSEVAREIREGRRPTALKDRLAEKGFRPGMTLVGVFDASFGIEIVTDFAEGEKAARQILRLLEEKPGLFVVWKEKKFAWQYSLEEAGDMQRAFADLARHPRCLFTGRSVSPSEVIALSDLTISLPFTSTCIEALGAGVKAIFLDPGERLRNCLFDQAPGLVAHGYDELRARVDELISQTDEEYSAYRRRHIQDRFEPFMDAGGLTRLRRLLSGATPAAVGQSRPEAATTL